VAGSPAPWSRRRGAMPRCADHRSTSD